MFRPKDPIDWPSLWADLLQGVGAGLLHGDGSRLAQAALLGLEAFDAAQERRRRRNARAPEDRAENREEPTSSLAVLDMSPTELAAHWRSSPQDQIAFEAEMAAANEAERNLAIPGRTSPVGGRVPMYPQREPLSVSPFAGWSLEGVLPFGPDGRLNLPTYRR